MVRRKRTSTTTTTKTLDKTRSLNAWGNLDKETLTLKCNQYNLIQTGNKKEMQRRLYDFFHNENATSSSTLTIEPTHDTNICDASSSVNNATLLVPATPISSVTSTHRNHSFHTSSDTSHLREEMKEQKSMILALQQRTANTEPHGSNETTTMNSPTPATEAPSQPFLSPMCHQNTADNSYQLYQHPSSSNLNNVILPSRRLPSQNAVQFNIKNNHHELTGNINNTTGINLYIPPAVDEKIMTKTLKTEYIDFNTLLPTSIPTIDQQSVGIHVISEDNFHHKSQTEKQNHQLPIMDVCIESVHHPHKHHALFLYQKELCYLVRRFKFEACYNYDKAHRKQIASQNRLPDAIRTASWGKRNDELYNIFLIDSSSHLPICFSCQNTGHYASPAPRSK